MSTRHAYLHCMGERQVGLTMNHNLDVPGDHPVDVPVICVITRFGLRSPHHLLPTYRDYRRILREVLAAQPSGLLRSAFLVENPTTCYNLSIWASREAIPRFGTNIRYHVNAGNSIFDRLSFREGRGPELWSTKWRLESVSHNLNWKEFDLRKEILGQK